MKEEESENSQNEKPFEVSEKYIEFVQSQLKKGCLEENIIDNLILQGMSKVDATDLVSELSFKSDPELNTSPIGGIALLITGIIVVVVGIVLLMLMLSNGRGKILPIVMLIVIGSGMTMKGHSIYSNR